MELNGRQQQQFQQALLSAFPSKNKLAQMVSFELDWQLDAIAGGQNLSEIAFSLIQHAKAEGKTDQLLTAARNQNPGNPTLRDFAQAIQTSANNSTSSTSSTRSISSQLNNSSTIVSEAMLAKPIDDNDPKINFLIRLGQQSSEYWSEESKPFPSSMLAAYKEPCKQFFQIDIHKFVDDVDPSFDITLFNSSSTAVVLHEFGLTLVSIAHEIKPYGDPGASEILQQASYYVDMPNIREDITNDLGRFPRLLEPRELNLEISANRDRIFLLEPQKTFRYELLLNKYVEHITNYSVVKFWVKTQIGKIDSDMIQIFTL